MTEITLCTKFEEDFVKVSVLQAFIYSKQNGRKIYEVTFKDGKPVEHAEVEFYDPEYTIK